jgi:hypothetical protein
MPRQGTARLVNQLTNISVNYKNSEFIAGDVLKDVPVVKDTDKYVVYASEFRIPESRRANGAPANQITWSLSHNSYFLEKHSFKDVITDDDRDNTDSPVDLDADTTEFLTDKIQLRQEKKAVDLLFTTTTWGNNATLNTATSWVYNTTTSAPIQNALSATTKILKSSGKMNNKCVMGWDVWAALKENQNVYSRFQYVQKAILTKDLLASLFDVDEVHVGAAIYDQAKEGGTVSQTVLWGSDCLFGYFNPNIGRKMVTAAVMFRSKRYGKPYTVKKWHDDNVDGDYIEVNSKYAPKAVATACGYFFKSVTLS